MEITRAHRLPFNKSGQMIIFPQPKFPWNKRISRNLSYLLGAQGRVRSLYHLYPWPHTQSKGAVRKPDKRILRQGNSHRLGMTSIHSSPQTGGWPHEICQICSSWLTKVYRDCTVTYNIFIRTHLWRYQHYSACNAYIYIYIHTCLQLWLNVRITYQLINQNDWLLTLS